MSVAPGAFSARNSHIPRSRMPPATQQQHGLRRTLSNASSSTQASNNARAGVIPQNAVAAKDRCKASSSSTFDATDSRSVSLNTSRDQNNYYSNNSGSAFDARSNMSQSRRSDVNMSNSNNNMKSGAATSSSGPYKGHAQYGGVPAYKNKNMTSRVYLPGEEEVVMSSKVVDPALAAADMELVENDLGRSSLMMPKSARIKMLAMRKDLFPGTEALLNGGGGGAAAAAMNDDDVNDDAVDSSAAAKHSQPTSSAQRKMDAQRKKERDPFFGAGGAGVSAGAVVADVPPPLPRGSQLLRRLQSSADRSAALLEELNERSANCSAMLDSLLLLGARKSPPAGAAARKKSIVSASTESLHNSPSSATASPMVALTPSPAARQQRRDENLPNLDDTFANVTPAAQRKQQLEQQQQQQRQGGVSLLDHNSALRSLERDESPPSPAPKRG